MNVILPWPPKELSPNARVHWAVKSRAVKKYKNDCIILCKAAKFHKLDALEVTLFITFFPPNNRKQDTDNMIASIKPAIDAISHITGVDDSKFKFELWKGDQFPGGEVHIKLFPVLNFPERAIDAIDPARLAS